MTTLWVLQVLFDLVVAVPAVLWLMSNKRNAYLEQTVEKLRFAFNQLKMSEAQGQGHSNGSHAHAAAPMAAPSPAVNLQTPATANGSSLQERLAGGSVRPERNSLLEAYEKAEILLSRGTDIREIARQTGLSFAELQLMGKVGHRTQ